MKTPDKSLDLSALRARLGSARGPRYWKSLEEIAETEGFQEFLRFEFPQGADQWEDLAGRRKFLKLMGASLALAGLAACTRQPKETIMPYVRAPEEIVPGKPLFFATAMPVRGMAQGILVESHMGRPTKVEGNPEHPASQGATEVLAQASLLTLYDPDRSQTIAHLGEISSWSAFMGELREGLAAQRSKKGASFRLLSETITSPTLAHQLSELLEEFPEAKWHQYDPACRDNVKQGARLVFGQIVETRYRFDKADVILSLDSDFLTSMPGSVRYAREFSARRRVRNAQSEMNRLYVVESTPSITGAKADHRWPSRAGEIEHVARAIAAAVGVGEATKTSESPEPPLDSKSLAALAKDLKNHKGKSLVIPGDEQPAEVHALAHAMNQALGNIGETVIYTDPVEANPIGQIESLRELTRDMAAGKVDLLVMLGGNPVYNAPMDLGFNEHLGKVKLRIHLSLFEDETSALCHWHIPEAHFLESWGDLRAYDGTVNIVQPLIAPLYEGKSAHEMLAALAGQPDRSGYDIVQNNWKRQKPGEDFEKFWRKSVHDGLIANTALPAKQVTLRASVVTDHGQRTTDGSGLEIIFRTDPHVFDGRFANNGWLQELPKPLTKLTWDNAALVSPRTAERLSLSNEQVVELKYQGTTVQAPIWILPGQPNDSVTVHLGYGRTRAGQVGDGAGFNAYALRSSLAPWFGPGLELKKTNKRYPLSCTQHHQSMEGRSPVRVGRLEEYRENPDFVQEMGENPPRSLTLYPEHKYEGYAWGMVIDLNACTGCNACTIACQAENNIAVVGKEQVAAGREMHWIRVDRYHAGEGEAALDNPATYHQPVPCMQCENAPCEVVCPVGATSHSTEGLNDMVYNRCVGTRYCSNNCPYKVRRFNFLLYSDFATPSLKMLRNPDVTVRSRGVMEKCTYCVQRINAAKIEAEKVDRPVRDGEIVTACEAVCPAQAIVFGNVNDPNSRVSKLKANKLNYGLLADLNTRPRTTYLAALRNPNPEMARDNEQNRG
jgi:molybdopterin-containing oxidoreductase family iron-sulfur binding subunit